jgi:hypothetical protein
MLSLIVALLSATSANDCITTKDTFNTTITQCNRVLPSINGDNIMVISLWADEEQTINYPLVCFDDKMILPTVQVPGIIKQNNQFGRLLYINLKQHKVGDTTVCLDELGSKGIKLTIYGESI